MLTHFSPLPKKYAAKRALACVQLLLGVRYNIVGVAAIIEITAANAISIVRIRFNSKDYMTI
jgi:hypothetical protein